MSDCLYNPGSGMRFVSHSRDSVYAGRLANTERSYVAEERAINSTLERLIANFSSRESLARLCVMPFWKNDITDHEYGSNFLYYVHEHACRPGRGVPLKIHVGSAFEIEPWYNSASSMKRVLQLAVEGAMRDHFSGYDYDVFKISLRRGRARYILDRASDTDRFVFALAGEKNASARRGGSQEVDVVVHLPRQNPEAQGLYGFAESRRGHEEDLNAAVRDRPDKRVACFDTDCWWETRDMPLWHPSGVSVLVFEDKNQNAKPQGFKTVYVPYIGDPGSPSITDEVQGTQAEICSGLHELNWEGKRVVDFSISYERANITPALIAKKGFTRVDMLWEEEPRGVRPSQEFRLDYAIKLDNYPSTSIVDGLRKGFDSTHGISGMRVVGSAVDYEPKGELAIGGCKIAPILTLLES